MARTLVDLNDLVSTWKDKTKLGDLFVFYPAGVNGPHSLLMFYDKAVAYTKPKDKYPSYYSGAIFYKRKD